MFYSCHNPSHELITLRRPLAEAGEERESRDARRGGGADNQRSGNGSGVRRAGVRRRWLGGRPTGRTRPRAADMVLGRRAETRASRYPRLRRVLSVATYSVFMGVFEIHVFNSFLCSLDAVSMGLFKKKSFREQKRLSVSATKCTHLWCEFAIDCGHKAQIQSNSQHS